MAKLIINIGLPASGKSTESENRILADGNTVRINKDLLRTMLHFDKFTGKNEGLTRDASRTLAKQFLANGTNVIIDDTNLNPGTKQSWVDLAKECDAKIEYLDMTHVSVEECIKRDSVRDKKVGRHVIEKMALQYLDYMKGETVVICDLDGTLADCSHRQHFVNGETKDWKSFFEGIPNDTVREEVRHQVAQLCVDENAKLIFVSARPENYRQQTQAWLDINYHNGVPLIMREANDKRPDTEVKSEIYEKYLKNLNIIKVFDDRPIVIKMWREKGLEVEDVGNGIDF
jgi:predicted kinase